MAVWDPDPEALPAVLPMTEYAESGRGLAIVNEITDRRLGWYTCEATGGKVVWARVGPDDAGEGLPHRARGDAKLI